MSLPTFRPNIALHTGLGLSLSGATLVKLHPSEAAGQDAPSQAESSPVIEIIYGAVVMVNTSGQETPVRLILGDMHVGARLMRNATLAVQVARSYVPGRNPAEQAPLTATGFAPLGGVSWVVNGQIVPIESPSQWAIRPGETIEPQPYTVPVAWLEREPVERLEERAAAEVREAIPPNSPAGTALLEVFYSTRRREVKSMAVRCSAYVGEFGPFIDALRDSEQRSAWDTHIATLRSAMALSPLSAEKVRETLVRERGEEAADVLYEMLRGYSSDEIGLTPEAWPTGALATLIDRLESDSLDYRVLAAHNLREITGKILLQNPAGNPTERAQGVRRWRQRLKDGELEPVAREHPQS
jgi:hypothetical protein